MRGGLAVQHDPSSPPTLATPQGNPPHGLVALAGEGTMNRLFFWRWWRFQRGKRLLRLAYHRARTDAQRQTIERLTREYLGVTES
jgi:hypothetical protein